jgi:hypothetical protein
MLSGVFMGSLRTIIDELAKRRFLVFFIIIWGSSMILYTACSFGTYGFGVEDAYDVIWILGNLFDLAAGIFLILFGLKLLKPNFLAALNVEKTLIYFLLLWAGQFILWGLYDLLFYEGIICFLAALVYLIAGIVLALSAYKLLNEKGTTASLPPPP